MFISAITVKATILLPIFMVVAAIFGASAFMTGSGANLLTVSLMMGAYSSLSFGYSDWLFATSRLTMTRNGVVDIIEL